MKVPRPGPFVPKLLEQPERPCRLDYATGEWPITKSAAKACRRMAEEAHDPTIKHDWLRIAETWLMMATVESRDGDPLFGFTNSTAAHKSTFVFGGVSTTTFVIPALAMRQHCDGKMTRFEAETIGIILDPVPLAAIRPLGRG